MLAFIINLIRLALEVNQQNSYTYSMPTITINVPTSVVLRFRSAAEAGELKKMTDQELLAYAKELCKVKLVDFIRQHEIKKQQEAIAVAPITIT